MRYQLHSTARRAFTLLELSVVLLVIALISGAGVTVATNALKAADRISTQQKLRTIKLALDSHAKTYGYLPCPAKLDITPSNQYFGVESRYRSGGGAWDLTGTNSQCAYTGSPAGFTGITLGTGAMFGAVPVRSLGLPDSYASDAWGNKLTYAVGVTNGFTQNPTTWLTQPGKFAILFSSGYRATTYRQSHDFSSTSSSGGLIQIAVSSTSGLTAGTSKVIVDGSTTKGTYTVSALVLNTSIDLAGTSWSAAEAGTVGWQDLNQAGAAAYVVVSHGPNGQGAYPMSGTTVPVACNNVTYTIDGENCDNDLSFYETDNNDDTASTGSYFDDYLVWGSNEGARQAVSKSIYTSGSASNCPTGICEAWCARCEYNYPGTSTGGSSNMPPTGSGDALNGGTIHNLCRKVVSSNSTDCKASCFWSGTTLGNTLYRCP